MVTVKPRIMKNNGAQALTRSRPGYNLETEDGLHPIHPQVPDGLECGDSGARMTVDYLLWDCLSEGKE
jgi:hypothetical protein